jgi:hypothetical protein
LGEWKKRRSFEAVVPVAYEGIKVSYPVSQKVKCQTLTCLVSASGYAYDPLVIVPNNKATEIFELLPIRKDVDIS